MVKAKSPAKVLPSATHHSAVTTLGTMEFTLRCNNLQCRKELSNQGVVTTCSHIFCLNCANQSQLFGPHDGCHRSICLACNVHLPNPDDVVTMNLKPTEDYKTIVLSGLTPSVIVECASRALGFWAYQATQEIVYQGYLSKNLTEKYGMLHTQMETIINNADAEIAELQSKMSNMALETEKLRHQNEDIALALREKSRSFLQLQELYDRQKGQERIDQVQHAASNAVEQTIQASNVANRFVDRIDCQNHVQKPPPPALFSQSSFNNLPDHISPSERNLNISNANAHGGHQTWAGYGGQGSISQEVQTPSNRPQRFPVIEIQNQQMKPPPPRRADITGLSYLGNRATPRQAPLRSISSNSVNGLSGYGMSAGLKVSNATTKAQDGYRSVSRPRALRPPGGYTNTRLPFGPSVPLTTTIPNGNVY